MAKERTADAIWSILPARLLHAILMSFWLEYCRGYIFMAHCIHWNALALAAELKVYTVKERFKSTTCHF